MKLCPQCAFIYEDDQKVCDMDGKALVSDSAPAGEPKASVPTRMTIDLSAGSESAQPRTLLVVLIVVLATLLSVVVLAQVRRSRSIPAVQPPQPARSAEPSNKLQVSAADRVSSSSVEVTAAAGDPVALTEPTPANEADPAYLKPGRLAASPVSEGVSGANSRGFLLHLTNGATIKADDVWERKEGIWYQQAGMVTFLKRSQVRAIERIATPIPQPKTAANADGGIRKSDARTAQNQSSARREETAEAKKPSRVKSFLRMTGRILKKPFKM